MKTKALPGLLLLLLLGCQTPVAPTRPRPVHPLIPPAATFSDSRAFGPVFQPAAVDKLVRWRHSVVTTNYWWDLQSSTNLKDWVTVQTNVGPSDVVVTNTRPHIFYRLRGRP